MPSKDAGYALGLPVPPPLGPYATVPEGDPFFDPLDGTLGRGTTLMTAYRRMMDARADATNQTRRTDMGYYRAGDEGWSVPQLTGGDFSMLPASAYASSASSAPAYDRMSIDAPGGPGIHRRRGRMHVTNVKALRRAMRRVVGFARVARKVMTFTSHHKLKKGRRGRR